MRPWSDFVPNETINAKLGQRHGLEIFGSLTLGDAT